MTLTDETNDTKEYHYIVRYSEANGWKIDADTESANFPEGTIYNTVTEQWEFGYLGDGKYNGQEDELCSQLSVKLADMNEAKTEVGE